MEMDEKLNVWINCSPKKIKAIFFLMIIIILFVSSYEGTNVECVFGQR